MLPTSGALPPGPQACGPRVTPGSSWMAGVGPAAHGGLLDAEPAAMPHVRCGARPPGSGSACTSPGGPRPLSSDTSTRRTPLGGKHRGRPYPERQQAEARSRHRRRPRKEPGTPRASQRCKRSHGPPSRSGRCRSGGPSGLGVVTRQVPSRRRRVHCGTGCKSVVKLPEPDDVGDLGAPAPSIAHLLDLAVVLVQADVAKVPQVF